MSDQELQSKNLSTEEKTTEKRFTSVKDIGLSADRNAKHRRRMEDTHCIKDALNGEPDLGFFAVYDGHGGKGASDYCANNLHNVLVECMKDLPDRSSDNVKSLLKVTFDKTDLDMKASVPSAGACVAVALVHSFDQKRWLHVANVGDTRAVLISKGTSKRLTMDHTPSVESEANRIIEKKGFIRDGRVNDMIAITRALGDHCMKEWIIGEPHIYGQEITDDDEYLIIACDGLWDVVNDDEAYDLIKSEESCTARSKVLLVEALKRGSTDNLSVLVVQL